MRENEELAGRSFARRAFLAIAATAVLIAPTLLRRGEAPPDGDELIIVNGWFLRKSDLIDPPQ